MSSIYKVFITPSFSLLWITHLRRMQIFKNQLDRDQKIVDLMASMADVYSFVDELKTVPDKINILENVIKSILQHTFECAMFIQEYSGQGFASA